MMEVDQPPDESSAFGWHCIALSDLTPQASENRTGCLRNTHDLYVFFYKTKQQHV